MLAAGSLGGAPYRVDLSGFLAALSLLEAIDAGTVDVGMASDAPFQFVYRSGSPIKAVAVQAATSHGHGNRDGVFVAAVAQADMLAGNIVPNTG